MTIRVGINGFGRMGRLALRAGWNHPDLTWVHINELKGDAATAAHLLTFDSLHGRWPHDVRGTDSQLTIDGQALSYSAHGQPGDVPWAEYGVDLVLECSGKFRTPATLAPYLQAGVATVIVAAPVKAEALNIVQLFIEIFLKLV